VKRNSVDMLSRLHEPVLASGGATYSLSRIILAPAAVLSSLPHSKTPSVLYYYLPFHFSLQPPFSNNQMASVA